MRSKFIVALIALACFCGYADAQGARFQSTATYIGSVNGLSVVRPVQTGYVSICKVVGSVCNSATTVIYSDQGLTTTTVNPIPLTKTGNFGFWGAPATYRYAICISPTSCSTYDTVLATQGPPGLDGCLNTPTNACLNLAQQQPTYDQFVSNLAYVAPTGDFMTRVNAAFAAALAAGKRGGDVVLMVSPNGTLPSTSVTAHIPTSAVFGNSFRLVCQSGAGWQYTGSGNATDEYSNANQYVAPGVVGCEIAGTSAAQNGITTVGVTTFGFATAFNYVHGFTNGCGILFTGPSVAQDSWYDRSTNNKYGACAQEGANSSVFHHLATGANSKWGFITPGSTNFTETVHLYDHVSEGDGTPSDPDSGSEKFETFHNAITENCYCEVGSGAGGGPVGIAVGTVGGPYYVQDGLQIIGGEIRIYSGDSGVDLRSGGNVTVGYFPTPGLNGAIPLRVRAGMGYYRSDAYLPSLDSGAIMAQSVRGTNYYSETAARGATSTRQSHVLSMLDFVQGSGCTPLSEYRDYSDPWAITLLGNVSAQSGTPERNMVYNFSTANPFVVVNGATLTLSIDSSSRLCGTVSGPGGTGFRMTMDGTYFQSAPYASGSITYDYNRVGAKSVKTPDFTLDPLATPTCDATARFKFNTVGSGPGVKDIVQVCAKDSSNAYAWRPIY